MFYKIRIVPNKYEKRLKCSVEVICKINKMSLPPFGVFLRTAPRKLPPPHNTFVSIFFKTSLFLIRCRSHSCFFHFFLLICGKIVQHSLPCKRIDIQQHFSTHILLFLTKISCISVLCLAFAMHISLIHVRLDFSIAFPFSIKTLRRYFNFCTCLMLMSPIRRAHLFDFFSS